MGVAAGDERAAGKRREEKGASRKLGVRKLRLGFAGLLVVAAIVIAAIALLGGDSSDDSSGGAKGGDAVALSAPQLLARVSELDRPAFWVGPRAGTDSYELSTTLDGRVYVRYLTGNAQAGDPRPDFLTVGAYPVPEAKQALEDAAKSAEAGQTLSRHEGYEALSASEATNAYVVFDNQPEVQIEIFSPQPGEAAQLATSGTLKPVG
jgi:hypothetical protein